MPLTEKLDRNNQIAKLHAGGESYNKLAKEFGVSPQRIAQLVGRAINNQGDSHGKSLTKLSRPDTTGEA